MNDMGQGWRNACRGVKDPSLVIGGSVQEEGVPTVPTVPTSGIVASLRNTACMLRCTVQAKFRDHDRLRMAAGSASAKPHACVCTDGHGVLTEIGKITPLRGHAGRNSVA